MATTVKNTGLTFYSLSPQIFCSRCSSHSAPLPRYGQVKPVRVCTHCYMFHVTPFYSDKPAIWSQVRTKKHTVCSKSIICNGQIHSTVLQINLKGHDCSCWPQPQGAESPAQNLGSDCRNAEASAELKVQSLCSLLHRIRTFFSSAGVNNQASCLLLWASHMCPGAGAPTELRSEKLDDTASKFNLRSGFQFFSFLKNKFVFVFQLSLLQTVRQSIRARLQNVF